MFQRGSRSRPRVFAGILCAVRGRRVYMTFSQVDGCAVCNLVLAAAGPMRICA